MERNGINGAGSSTGRRKSWNDRTAPMRSSESSESGEIQMEGMGKSEHPRAPLIPDLSRPPSRSTGLSIEKWLSRKTPNISQQPELEPNDLRSESDLMEPPMLADLKPWALFRYHLSDWLQIALVFLIWLLCFLVTPFQRHVGATHFVTSELRYPFKENTIPFQVVPVIAVFVPLVFILGNFFNRRNIRDLHHGILGLLTAVALTALITDAVKIGIGRPRPHFYARCFGSPLALPNYDPVTGNAICSGTVEHMKEAFKSFPSGHTSWTFAGLSYLAMYMAGKLSIFDRKGHSWKIFPIVVVMLGATFVGVTRIDDYWHHWTDVCAGASIGTVTAYFCYRQHFRSLFDDSPHIPYDYIPKARAQPKRSESASVESSSYDLEQGRR